MRSGDCLAPGTEASRLHPPPSQGQTAEQLALKVGDKVEARFQGRSKWFKATIIQSHAYGTFDVEYEDGDRETNVAAELIRPVEGARRDDRGQITTEGWLAAIFLGARLWYMC
jgi:hypothetical protein